MGEHRRAHGEGVRRSARPRAGCWGAWRPSGSAWSSCSSSASPAWRSTSSDRWCWATRRTSSSPACSAAGCPPASPRPRRRPTRAPPADDTTATLIESQNVVPGAGVDFAALGRVLLLVVAIYVAASLLAYLQGWLLNGIVQRTIAALRRDVEDKLHRLPLGYVDARARGELLSRVTNDIDNVSQSLQQTMSQLLTSLLTVVGVLVMMVVISPLLAVIALLTVPLSTWMTRAIARRSQGEFVAQWRYTGELNGQIEEAFTGHELVTVFGRRGEVEATFAAKNAQLRGRELPGAVRLGDHHAVDDVPREPQLRRGGGDRRPAGRDRGDDPGRGPGVHPVLPAVHPAAHPGGVDGEPAAVRGGVGRAGVRAARRARAGAGAGGAGGACAATGPGGVRARVVPLPPGRPADRRPVAGRRARADRRDRGPDGRGQDHAGEPRDALLRAGRGPDHAGRRGHRDDGARGPALRDRDGAAGHLAVRRHDPGEHRLRQPGGDRGAAARRGPCDLRRPVRPQPARRLRHPRRLRRRRGQRRGEAADHDRAGVPGRPVAADPGRGHQLGRHAHRGARAAGDGPAAQRPHELRHRPPALHDPRRGPDPRDGRAAGSSSRARTTSCWPRTAPTTRCTRPSSPRRRCSDHAMDASPRQRIASGSPFEPTIGFSRAVRVGDRVLVSGTAPVFPDGSCPDDVGAPGPPLLHDHRDRPRRGRRRDCATWSGPGCSSSTPPTPTRSAPCTARSSATSGPPPR